MTRGSLLAWILAAALVAAIALPLVRVRATPGAAGGPWRSAFDRIRRSRSTRVAIVTIIALYVMAALAPILAPHAAHEQLDTIGMVGAPPSASVPFGTDLVSRDVFSRVILGSRVSLSIALLAVLLSITVGTVYGAVAGYAGGRVDAAMMRLIDAALSIPRILLLITVTALWGTLPIPVLIALIGLTGWFGVSRIVRGEVMSLSAREFIVSARALGAGRVRVLARHILPNVLSPIVIAATLGIGNVIILETALSYLGLGFQPPSASWGNMIADGSSSLDAMWWVALFPGLAIVVTVMAFNAVGEGLRDAFDPR